MNNYRNILLYLYTLKKDIKKGKDKKELLFNIDMIVENIKDNLESEREKCKYLLEDIEKYNNIINIINNENEKGWQ